MDYIYFGSDNFSLHLLEGLCEVQKPIAIVTQPDRASGRKQKLQSGPLAIYAKEKNIPLIQPENLKTKESQEAVLDHKADLFIVVSFGQILPQSFLDLSPTIINGHASLLPLLRGASPIQSSILQGHKKTGMSVMHIVKALDAGPVVKMGEVVIEDSDTGGTLSAKLEKLGIEQLKEMLALKEIPKGVEQDHDNSTHCHKITKNDMRLRCETEPSEKLSLQIRALAPSFGAYVILKTRKGELRAKIYESSLEEFHGKENSLFQKEKQLYLNGCDKSQTLRISKIQPQGKAVMDVASFLNGWNMDFEGELVLP